MEKRICTIGSFLKWYSNENDLSKLSNQAYDIMACWAIKDGELIYGEPNEELADNGKSYLELLIANEATKIDLYIEPYPYGAHSHLAKFKFEHFEFEIMLLGFPFEQEFMPLID